MIVKSMSRKVPSFGQLIGYIDRDEGQEPYRIRHNLLSRDPARIRAEFERNGDLLQRRRNGVYLYHEIISITRAQCLSAEEQKSRLYEIAQSYIAARCPDNLVFGGLHQDKEHSFHYHLMISANRAGETGRLRLTKNQFRQIQVGLENHVLAQFPELEQKVAIGKRSDRKFSRSEAELERRTGERPKRDEVLERAREAFASSGDRDSLLEALGRFDLELYVRGKNLGIVDHESGKRHRLKTLDAELADRIEGRMMELSEPEAKSAPEGEKENHDADQVIETELEPLAHAEGDDLKREPEPYTKGQDEPAQETENSARVKKKKSQSERRKKRGKDGQTDGRGQTADKEAYVKYDSNTDLKSDTASQQNPQAEAKTNEKKTGSRDEDEMKLKDIMGVRDTLKDKRKANAATKDDVARAADAVARKAEARVKQEMDKTADATAKRTADQVRQEFERMTAKQKESAKHMPKHKR